MTAARQEPFLRDVPERDRYEWVVDGEVAGHEGYALHGTTIVLQHTVVREAFQGRGVAGQLVRAVLEDVRARGLTLVAECPYVQGFLAKHPGEYADLLPG